jgi:hypothetical protein
MRLALSVRLRVPEPPVFVLKPRAGARESKLFPLQRIECPHRMSAAVPPTCGRAFVL